MKQYLSLILTLLLAAALLSVCAAAHAETAAAEGEAFAGAFSRRDLSGAYSDEVYAIRLTGDTAETDSDRVSVSGSVVTVTGAGTYILSGTLADGCVVVDADKEEKVQLVLSGVTINSDSFAAIYIARADKVFVTLAEGTENTLSNGGSFQKRDGSGANAVIYAKDDLTLNGSGALTISSPAGHGIVGKDEVTITGGSYAVSAGKHAITAKDSLAVADGSFTLNAGKDALHAENGDDDTLGSIYLAGGSFAIRCGDDAIHAVSALRIDSGSYDITGAEGLEATYIQINGGVISISASDDGINAAHKSHAYTPTVELNGGELTITVGTGDSDGVDANGDLIVNGGVLRVTGSSAFDVTGSAVYNGGTVIVNGQQVDSIPAGRMGGKKG